MRLARHASILPIVLTGLGVACSSSKGTGGAVNLAVAPSILFPAGVLDSATALDLTVYDTKSGVVCDPTTATVTGVTSALTPVATKALGTQGCTGTAKFCGALTITKGADSLVFFAQALDASQSVIADGCTTATVNQDTLAVSITMQRYISPATCGNGVIEPTEQCDPPTPDGGTDIVCDQSCHTQEEILSTGVSSPAGPASFLWPLQSGTPGELYSFFTAGTSNLDVALRVMSDSLEPVTSPLAAEQAILAPNGNGFPPAPLSGNQSAPSATLSNGLYYYVFESNPNGDPDIYLHAFDSSLADVGGVVGINGVGGAGEQNQQLAPSVAASSNGVLFVAWQDLSSGQIVGRTYSPSADAGAGLGTQEILSTGASNENVRVAATPTGWIAVWDDTQSIKMRVISSSGTPSGAEIAVSTGSNHAGVQDHPGVAVLGDGRTAVVWADHGSAQADVYVQRYDSSLAAVAGDQATPINDVVTAGDQLAPAIAGSGKAFVAAWIDSPTGNVQAAVLGGSSGYLFNPINGQATEFQASLAPNINRLSPVVAIGGAGPWIAIGWNDASTIYARRFPTVTE